MKSVIARTLPLLALLLVGAVGCTNKQGETEAAVFLTVELKDQPGFVDIGCNAAVQFQTINIASHFKNPNTTDPLHLQDVQLNTYKVTYSRLDGGHTVPAAETFSAGGLVPSGGTAKLNNFEGMYGYAVQQSPFDQLLPFNGGIDRETGNTQIVVGFTFVFYGETASGQSLASDPATAGVTFFYNGCQ